MHIGNGDFPTVIDRLNTPTMSTILPQALFPLVAFFHNLCEKAN
jgi:hypothetical protein